ncbi:MAG TPA: 50S ribosomal protein L23 [bacterium]|jgi:large subunit ribosomal protein L23|nr:50S ribosomal protein L23 [bacterium]
MEAREILRKPIITEKSTILMEEGKYTFQVHPAATKIDIKNAVEEIFNVDVIKVVTIKAPGKLRRMGHSVGRTSDRKKAIVAIAEGQRIPFFEGA